MSKYLAIFAVVGLLASLAGCAGGGAAPVIPEDEIRVETLISTTYMDYEQAADLVGTQTWRVYGDRPERPVDLVPVERDAITINRGAYLGAYTEWTLTALSSWRTDLNVVVGGEIIKTIFVCTEHVWPEKLHITVAGALQTDETRFSVFDAKVGIPVHLDVNWVHDDAWGGYPRVPVVWKVPAGLNLAIDPDSKSVRITPTTSGEWTLVGDVAGKQFTVRFIVE